MLERAGISVSNKNLPVVENLRRSRWADLAQMIDTASTPSRSKTLLFFCSLAAILCFPVLVASATFLPPFVIPQAWASSVKVYLSVTLMFVAVPLAQLGTTLFLIQGRRELSKFPELALLSRRAPTLYLRPFAQENPQFGWRTNWKAILMNPVLYAAIAFAGYQIHVMSGVDTSERRFVEVVALAPVILALVLFQSFRKAIGGLKDRSFEKLVSDATGSIGPLICLQDPQRRQKTGEALRLRIKDEFWQRSVALLEERSNLVVLVYSARASMDWEATLVAQAKHPVLIYIPRLDDAVISGVRTLKAWVEVALSKPQYAAVPGSGLLLLVTPEGRVRGASVRPEWSDLQYAARQLLEASTVTPAKNRFRGSSRTVLAKLCAFILGAGWRFAVVATGAATALYALMAFGVAAAGGLAALTFLALF